MLLGDLRGYKEEETSTEDILLSIRDTPLDAKTLSLYELMFHRRVKSDLPSIPLSLFDGTNSINAGHRSVKHAERTNESENRGEPQRLEQHQTVKFMKNPQEKKADGQVGRSFQWTDNNHTLWKTTQPEHTEGPYQANSRRCLHSTYCESFFRKTGRRCISASGYAKHQGYG